MRITRMFAILLAVAGVSAISPASAETSLTRPTTIAAPISTPSGTATTADQYRDRGRGYYGPRYAYARPYRWRGSRLVCRTSWRWGRPHRVCFRRW